MFGCPRKIVANNDQVFKSTELVDFFHKYNIILGHSNPYYPQGNGLENSSNKSLIRIIKNMLFENKKGWDSKLKYALWANKISRKKSIGTSHSQLVYGK